MALLPPSPRPFAAVKTLPVAARLQGKKKSSNWLPALLAGAGTLAAALGFFAWQKRKQSREQKALDNHLGFVNIPAENVEELSAEEAAGRYGMHRRDEEAVHAVAADGTEVTPTA
ncbi:hypothetical protein [Hymenobacter sp. YC55]|uniref:hypothetical protein n=1 Tax=Hymenobacter sp. YC55 TaxID=3034019 RepID=UPI0023F778B0|nr:hypothetical protein [Hymenobacter sp. YC55]MDF7815405.1 hypothetical protein [Hymenobacter sp. YC55]